MLLPPTGNDSRQVLLCRPRDGEPPQHFQRAPLVNTHAHQALVRVEDRPKPTPRLNSHRAPPFEQSGVYHASHA